MNDKELTANEYTILAKLYIADYYKPKNSTSIAAFERFCGYKEGNPTTRRLFKYLYEHTDVLIVHKESILGTKLFYLNKKALGKLIKNHTLYKLSKECLVEDIP